MDAESIWISPFFSAANGIAEGLKREHVTAVLANIIITPLVVTGRQKMDAKSVYNAHFSGLFPPFGR